jgi:hypothetical protein
MKKLNTLFASFALLLSLAVQSQTVTIMTQDMTVNPGENFQLDVQVEDFDVIATVQFAMFWDPTIVEYVGVSDFGLPDLSVDGNFGEMNTADGKLRFNWVDPDPFLSGVTLDDETTIFSIVFKAIGGPGQSTAFEIAEDPVFPPMPVEVVNTSSEVEVNIINSTITMDGVSSSYETKTSDFVLMQNNPNPFIEKTNISFELNHTSNTQLSIYDHTGKIVFEQSKMYSSGSHTVQIARNLFQSAGSYFYTLKTEHSTATRQLVVQ